MNMTGRFKCPECKGEGYIWMPPTKYFDHWHISECGTCESHRFVLTDESGTIIGPDKPPQYLCEHKEVLDKCNKCRPVFKHAPCIECFSTTCACMADSF